MRNKQNTDRIKIPREYLQDPEPIEDTTPKKRSGYACGCLTGSCFTFVFLLILMVYILARAGFPLSAFLTGRPSEGFSMLFDFLKDLF